MRRIWILGAGGFAVEVYSWLNQCLSVNTEGEFAGFVDDFCVESEIVRRVGLSLGQCAIMKINNFKPNKNDWCICALGSPSTKAVLLPELKKLGFQFMTLIHPTAIIGANVEIGEGSVVCPKVILSGCNRVGRFSSLNFFSSMSHDVISGDFCTMNPYSSISGKCKLGDRVSVGSHAVLYPGVVVGDDATIGIGSVVLNRVRNGKTVFGIPAAAVASPTNDGL